MKEVIYRRENLSIAWDDSRKILGCNLWIWYGFSQDLATTGDMIIDAITIKEIMKKDLKRIDHSCISVPEIIDIIDVIVNIGKKVFDIAQKNHLLYEIIIEDIYGDSVFINKSTVRIEKKYLYNEYDNRVVYCCNDQERIRLMGLPYKTWIVTSKDNIPIKQLERMLNNPRGSNCHISCIDAASESMCTFAIGNVTPEYYTVQCIEQIAHRLTNIPQTEKCSNLHGHTYKCRITIKNTKYHPLTQLEIINLENRVRNKLKEAFLPTYCTVTTIENVLRYVTTALKKEYCLIWAELSETPNIKVREYFGDLS